MTLIKNFIIMVICMPLFLSCTTTKSVVTNVGATLEDNAIYRAIDNFTTRCELFNKDSVFVVKFQEEVYDKATLIKVDNSNAKWERGKLLDGIVFVGITGNSGYQYYYSEETKSKLPTRYLIRNGKLFIWWDEHQSISDEMISVLWKFNALQKYSIISDFHSNESDKGAHYYFRKNDLSKFKRILTNVGFGYYTPPKI